MASHVRTGLLSPRRNIRATSLSGRRSTALKKENILSGFSKTVSGDETSGSTSNNDVVIRSSLSVEM